MQGKHSFFSVQCNTYYVLLYTQAWAQIAKGLAWLHARGMGLAAAHRAHIKRSVLTTWRRTALDAIVLRKMGVQAVHLYCFVTLAKAVREWKVWAAWAKYKQGISGRAVRFERAARLRKGLKGWRERVAYRRAAEHRLREVRQWYRCVGLYWLALSGAVLLFLPLRMLCM